MNDSVQTHLGALRDAIPDLSQTPALRSTAQGQATQPPWADRRGFKWDEQSPAPTPAPAATSVPTPYELLPPVSPAGGDVLARVNPQSFLLAGSDAQSFVAIAQLDTNLALAVGLKLWVEVALGGTPSATIASGMAGWTSYPRAGTFTGSGTTTDPWNQTKAYWPIAFCVAATDPRPGKVFTNVGGSLSVKVIQTCDKHLRLIDTLDNARGLTTFEFAPLPVP